MLVTGMHVVADINCIDCHSLLGWKYKEAHEESQKYKEGHYILEESKITLKPKLIPDSLVPLKFPDQPGSQELTEA